MRRAVSCSKSCMDQHGVESMCRSDRRSLRDRAGRTIGRCRRRTEVNIAVYEYATRHGPGALGRDCEARSLRACRMPEWRVASRRKDICRGSEQHGWDGQTNRHQGVKSWFLGICAVGCDCDSIKGMTKDGTANDETIRCNVAEYRYGCCGATLSSCNLRQPA